MSKALNFILAFMVVISFLYLLPDYYNPVREIRAEMECSSDYSFMCLLLDFSLPLIVISILSILMSVWTKPK